MDAEKFHFIGVTITGKYICESKNWIRSFLLMSLSKTVTQFPIITTLGRRKLPISPKTTFFWKSIFLHQDGGRLWSWKNDQN